MRTIRRNLVCAATAVVAAVAIVAVAATAASAVTTWVKGDVFAGVSNGSYNVYSNSGTFKETISDGSGGFTTGCAFNPTLTRLYTTNYSSGNIVAYNDASPHTIAQTINTSADGGASPESIAFDAAGNFFVGHAGGNKDIFKFNAAGTKIGQFDVATQNVGSDWITLAKDQKTIFYTSEGGTIFRYDTSTSTQLAPFANVTDESFALRLLPPFDGTGGLLVASTDNIKRLNGSGNVVQTYDVAGADSWFALNLDPNGTSFWSGDVNTGAFYRFNIQSGAVEVGPIIAAGTFELFGLCVKGEITGENTPPSCKLTATFAGPPKGIQVTVQDGGATDSGLKSIVVTKNVNANVVVPPFTQGTKNAVVVTATRVDNNVSAQVALRVTDMFGNVTNCDPVLTTVVRENKPQVFADVPDAEHLVTVVNNSPGLRLIAVTVNGTAYRRNLRPGQEVNIDVSTSIKAGANTFGLRGFGPGSAEIIIWDGNGSI
jgi:hypothetical protein